jgi:hypothetical protein
LIRGRTPRGQVSSSARTRAAAGAHRAPAAGLRPTDQRGNVMARARFTALSSSIDRSRAMPPVSVMLIRGPGASSTPRDAPAGAAAAHATDPTKTETRTKRAACRPIAGLLPLRPGFGRGEEGFPSYRFTSIRESKDWNVRSISGRIRRRRGGVRSAVG